jgi:hypothetical protein
MAKAIQNEKGFNSTLVAIKKSGEALAQYIHNAGMFALEQVNTHGNDGFAVRLLEAMGKKHDAARVEKWLCHYGKLGMKAGKLVYRARRDINAETIEAMLTEAEATPYWELTEQTHHVFKFNGLSMLQAIVNRLTTAKEKAAAGVEVEIISPEVVEEVSALLAKHKAAAGAAAAAAIAAQQAPAAA